MQAAKIVANAHHHESNQAKASSTDQKIPFSIEWNFSTDSEEYMLPTPMENSLEATNADLQFGRRRA